MYRSIQLLILIFGCLSCYAQVETIKLSGVIYDSATKEPIEYANIYVAQTTVGTVSPRLGDFELNIPKAILPNTVTISCIGYQSRVIPIERVADADVRIQLNQGNDDCLVDLRCSICVVAPDGILRGLKRIVMPGLFISAC